MLVYMLMETSVWDTLGQSDLVWPKHENNLFSCIISFGLYTCVLVSFVFVSDFGLTVTIDPAD